MTRTIKIVLLALFVACEFIASFFVAEPYRHRTIAAGLFFFGLAMLLE